MNSPLDNALAFTLGNEGGYVNHPADPGGATNFGIIQRNLDKWNGAHPELGFPGDVKDLTKDQASTIYRTDYWRWDGLSDAAIAIKLFDIGVNCSLEVAVKLLQKALNTLITAPISVDGQPGPATLGAANAQSPSALMQALCQAQKNYYQSIVDRNPSQSVFLKGWLRRADRIPEAPHVV
ncbi:glycoside hydrolase family 108 protein [Geothrix sp. PMB-07]|uniref:glycoside hydrolase family 108 protein n=1 Tax=Geothrix sp. PMB-07 TaxID=3068640 RepID=UPI0027428016|nr:glycosyl hydrolase 108 family protein [Geothrix sp. PMB-07]WLT32693.1 glycosyl hydrolase 108 family protein [Geothrix sp. PMB-07]